MTDNREGEMSDKVQEAAPRRRLGRPSLERAAEIDRLILDLAQVQFLAMGYVGLSMNKLAADASISKETLYARYSNKQALFEAVAQDRLAAWSLRAPKPNAREATLEGRLLRRAKTILESISTPDVQAFERLLSSEAARFPQLARQFYDQGYRLITENVRDDLCAALGGGPDAAQEAASAAAIFGGALIGWFRVESAVRSIGKSERERFAQSVVRNCQRSLGLA
jgi:TetR/AcrR family transcriptional repressor of mexJK operon